MPGVNPKNQPRDDMVKPGYKLLIIGVSAIALASYLAYESAAEQKGCQFLGGTSQQGGGGGPCIPAILGMQLPNSADDVVGANNRFALDLYSELSKEEDNGNNIFFSPTSILTAFAVVYEGANGNTADEIRDAFGLPQDDSKRRSSFESMIADLNGDDKEHEMRLANALWLAKGFEPHVYYVDVARDSYGSQVTSVDFGSGGVDLINDWVAEKTEGNIGEIFSEDPSNSEIAIAVTNAIYFKGMWAVPFDAEKTRTGDFYTSPGTAVRVPMMELESTFLNLARTDQARIVELPYEGDRASMLILLPEDVGGIKSLEESITADNLRKWTEGLQKMKTKVYLPRFQLETTYDLIPVLQALGIHDAFEGAADFSGISGFDLSIHKAVHKAFVDVNEEGTEAAAATGIAMLQSGPIEFRADHPFVFVIQDKGTGQILFMGRVMDPSE